MLRTFARLMQVKALNEKISPVTKRQPPKHISAVHGYTHRQVSCCHLLRVGETSLCLNCHLLEEYSTFIYLPVIAETTENFRRRTIFLSNENDEIKFVENK
jgi:hypothetical protein